MKNLVFAITLLLLSVTVSFAQRNVTPAIDRDPLLEADATHNLDVARQAFGPARKAYKQVLLRFEETYAAYPDFSKIDEFLYLAGMSSYYLSKNEGRQKVNLKVEKERERYNPERLREDTVAYLSLMLERNPGTKYRSEAEQIVKELSPPN
ncbi:hypothetical protein BH24ACI3_BH24ACI3_11830 [soil metagenome]